MNGDVVIVGGGIGGLTLALELHAAGIPCRVYEAVPEMKALGVGINVLPHAQRELTRLGLEPALAAAAIETKEAAFYNRFGQHIYSEPLGRYAGYAWPQFSIHRGDLHRILLDAAVERLGRERVLTGHRCTSVASDAAGVTVRFNDVTGARLGDVRGAIAVACDGINSAVRKQFFPNEPEPRYSGVTMWRGVTKMKPVLSGATFVRAGWLASRAIGRVAATSRISPVRTPAGSGIGSTSQRCFAMPKRSSSIRWSIRNRCRAGPSNA